MAYHQYAGNDTFYESCGQYGQSDVRHVRLRDGAVLRKTPVDGAYFAEGLTAVGDTLLQLTWQTNKGALWLRVGLHARLLWMMC